MVVSMKIDAGLVKQVKAGFSWTAFFNKQTAHYYLEHGYKPVGGPRCQDSCRLTGLE